MKHIKTAISLFIALMVVVAVIYPLLVTSVSKILFPWHANGSLIHDAEGKVIGSMLIGQPFSDPKYFWSRPSATAEFPYNPLASGGSQLGPTNAELIRQISERVESLQSSGIQGPILQTLLWLQVAVWTPTSAWKRLSRRYLVLLKLAVSMKKGYANSFLITSKEDRLLFWESPV